jgi:putative oxidoreductase
VFTTFSSDCQIPQKWDQVLELLNVSNRLGLPVIWWRSCVQRLFSSFANGWPGAGLLIQRLLVGVGLLYFAAECLSRIPFCRSAVPQSIGAAAGILLVAGLWTPLAGVLAASVEAWIAVSASENAGMPVALAVLALTLAMIGPGAWSADARRYGRKRIDMPER